MLSISYRIKDGRNVINSILNHNGTRIELSTGIKVPNGIMLESPRTLRGGSQDVRLKIDSQIHDWESVIRNKYNSIVASNGYSFSPDVFRAGMRVAMSNIKQEDTRLTLSAFMDKISVKVESGRLYKKNGKLYAGTSLINFRSLISVIEKYIARFGDFDFGKYNVDTEALLGKGTVIKAYDEMAESLKAFMSNDMSYSDRTIRLMLSLLHTIIADEAETNAIQILPRYLAKLKWKVSTKPVVIALSEEQFEYFISNFQSIMSDAKCKSERMAIEFMYAGLLTSARVSDLYSLTSSNLIKDGEQYFLYYIPSKTKDSSQLQIEIPLVESLATLFVENSMKYNGYLLPRITRNSLRNITIVVRTVLRRYDIFTNRIQYVNKRGQVEIKRFCDVFKFHSTRASLITYLLSKGEQETVIKSISGHTLDSTSFKAYTNITNKTKMRTISRLEMIR